MHEYTRRSLLVTAGTGLAASASTGIAGADSEGQTSDGSSDQTDRVRVVHLSPDAPVVDVYVDGDLAFEGVEPFATRTDYLPYESGTHTVAFAPAGKGRNGAVFETEVTLESGPYTLAAIGEVCAMSDRPLRLVRLGGDHSPTSEGKARVRAVHAAPDAPAVNVATERGTTIAEGLAFGDAATVEIPATAAVAVVQGADTEDPIARFPIHPETGHVYTAYGVGYLDPQNAPEAAPDDSSFALAITEDAAPGER